MIYNEKLKRNIPYEWSVDNVKSCITHINTGLNPRYNFVLNNGNIKYITVKNLTTQGSIDFSNSDTIDEVAQKTVHKRSDISKGDILFASIAPLGRCYLIQEEPQTWDINESVFSIRPKNTMPSEYLYMFLMSETFVKKAENSSTGSVFAGIRIKTLENMLMVIPDEKILKQFKEKISKILLQKYSKECENQELTSIRDFLLPMLMNGQVTIRQ
ncbi:MAG: restriction endonuclease subunit S [Candidatus Gastranaerophilaceae bacterium]